MGIPIFFCERTGEESFVLGFECEQGHKAQRVDKERSQGWPTSIECPTCAEPAECRSISSNIEMRRVDTGETFARAP